MQELQEYLKHYGYDKDIKTPKAPFAYNPDTLAAGLYEEAVIASDFNGIMEHQGLLTFATGQEMLAVLADAGITPNNNYQTTTDETQLIATSQFLQALKAITQDKFKVMSGQVKLNSYGADIKPSWTPATLPATTLVQITYGALGVQETLNFSSAPTSTIPPNWGSFDGTLFYDYTNGHFLENQVLGQSHSYRLLFKYTKTINENPTFEIRISNPLSTFSTTQYRQLPTGKTSGDFDINFKTFADQASLKTPLGTGTGYKIEISKVNAASFTSLSLDSIAIIYEAHQDLYQL